jgi:hypothetical protein
LEKDLNPFPTSELQNARISLSKCRKILKNPNLHDEDIEQIRDTLYGFAEMLTERFVREHPRKRNSHPDYEN